MQSGIYRILNIINNKSYIGSSENLDERKRRHFRDLLNNKHHSILLQRSYTKYGVDNFKFEIIEICSKESLLDRENYYFAQLNCEYNIAKIAGSPKGVKHSKEFKDLQRKLSLARNSKPPVVNERSVVMLDLNDNLIAEFSSITKALKFLGKNNTFVSTISSVCSKKLIYNKRNKPIIRKTAFGYKWKFKELEI